MRKQIIKQILLYTPGSFHRKRSPSLPREAYKQKFEYRKRWSDSCLLSRVCVISSDTHQRANQTHKIGAAAKFQSAFLPGTGENDPFHRIHGSRKNRAGQLIGAAINLQGCLLLFWNFFLVGQEKSASFPLNVLRSIMCRGSVTAP